LPEGETPEQALAPASIQARIDAQLAMIGHAGTPWQMDWASVYSARAMTLPDYVHGRVVFTGDAAHMLPIFGVRGANTGFQDAQNLGWKLAARVKGQGTPALLASYSAERVQAAREIIDEAGKSTRFMTPPTRGFRLLRDATLSLALRHEFVRPLLHWRTSRAHDYLASSLNARDDDDAAFGAGPRDGAPMPDVRLADGTHLMDAMAPAFHLLVFVAGGATLPAALVDVVTAQRQRGVPLVVWAVTETVDAVAAADRGLHDADGRIRRKFGVAEGEAMVLIRPDQHVCARWPRLATDALPAAVARALGQ
jgi:3-(3-hydroxy-phenyl)propionate hydroxylase